MMKFADFKNKIVKIKSFDYKNFFQSKTHLPLANKKWNAYNLTLE